MPRRPFDDAAKAAYCAALRAGLLKREAARQTGFSYQTVRNHLQNDPDFAEAAADAHAEATESVETVLYDLAKQGDLSAIRMWLKAHDRDTYGEDQKLTIDATEAAVQLSANQAFAKIAELRTELERRAQRIHDEESVITVEEIERRERSSFLPVIGNPSS